MELLSLGGGKAVLRGELFGFNSDALKGLEPTTLIFRKDNPVKFLGMGRRLRLHQMTDMRPLELAIAVTLLEWCAWFLRCDEEIGP